jgi:cytochrome P450
MNDIAVDRPMRTDVDLADADVARDRSGWSFLTSQGPVFQDKKGMYCITTREGCQFVLQHPEIFSSAKAFAFEQTPYTLIPIAVDPPQHGEYRRAVSGMFAPRAVNALEGELRRQAVELIEAFEHQGSCDINRDLGRLFPTQVFLTIFGLPLEDRDACAQWVSTVNGADIDFTAGHGEGAGAVAEASQKMTDYLAAAIKKKRANATDDILGRIIALDGTDSWSDDEILGFGWIMLLAGLDTVASAIGFIFYYLATRPDLRRRIVDDPTAIDLVIEEVLRLETVAPWVPRYTTQDTVVEGYAIPANSFVAPMIAVANRDPKHYGNPHELDIEQRDRGHFTFGGGTHRCIGSHLARKELRILLEEFHRRIPDYSLAPGVEPTVHWPSGTINFESLPIVFKTEES